eukprot:m.184494 g.184494  ORF g.184494 m.184494 type:complete len:760 (-) comp13597_c2_seq4:751-3030(-)
MCQLKFIACLRHQSRHTSTRRRQRHGVGGLANTTNTLRKQSSGLQHRVPFRLIFELSIFLILFLKRSMSSNSKDISLSVEESDALRAKLGLSKLKTGKDDTQVAAPGTSTMENDVLVAPVVPGQKKSEEEMRERLRIRREKRKNDAKFKAVKTLGQEENDGSAVAWIKRNRRKQKELEAAKKQSEKLAEQDEELGTYTAEDLKGMRVDHDIDELTEGKDVILTFEDKGVLDVDEAKLVNVNIAEDAHTKRKLLESRHGAGYDPKKGVDDEDEFLGINKPSVLGKYDNVDSLTGDTQMKQETFFRIGMKNELNDKERKREEVKQKLQQAMSLTSVESTIVSDFYTDTEMEKFKKKPKKKKKKNKGKSQRRKRVTADDLLNSAEDGGNDIGSEEMDTRFDVVDEDDILDTANDAEEEGAEKEMEAELLASLTRARNAKINKHKRKKRDVAELLSKGTSSANVMKADVEKSDVVFTAMTEFVRGVGAHKAEDDKEQAAKKAKRDAADAKKKMKMKIKKEKEMKEEEDEIEKEKEKMNKGFQLEQKATEEEENMKKEEEEVKEEEEEDDEEEGNVLGDEGSAGLGVMAALNLAKRKGLVDNDIKKKSSLSTNVSSLKSQRFTEDKGATDDNGSSSGSGRDRDRRDRDRDRRMRDRDDSRLSRDRGGDVFNIKGYKPSFRITHTNEAGEDLTPKKAFQHMSHRFHGITPGKMKTEKRLRKKKQEEQLKKLGTNTSGLGSIAGMRRHQEATGKAHLVLSGSKKQM